MVNTEVVDLFEINNFVSEDSFPFLVCSVRKIEFLNNFYVSSLDLLQNGIFHFYKVLYY